MSDSYPWRRTPRHRGLPHLGFLWDRDHGICQICWEGCTRADATRDHIVPFSMGGSNEAENLRLAHRWCNVARADRELTPFETMIVYARIRGRMGDPTSVDVYGYDVPTGTSPDD